MKFARLPEQEPRRLAALRRYHVLDTAPESAFDDLTRLASKACGAPIALITLLDEKRQWFKSRVGLEATHLPRNISFCSHTILQGDIMVVEDAAQDERFADNPMVISEPHLRFYAGAPLTSADGFKVGALCVIDRTPRTLTGEQAETLRILSRQVVTQLELRRHLVELARSIEEQKRTEDRLRTSEAFYQTLVETLPQNIIRKDLQGRFTFANRKFCNLIGKPLDAILGRTDFDLFPVEMASKYHRDDLRVMSTLDNLDTIEAHRAPSGERLFVHVIKTPLYDAVGRLIGIQGIFWDVSSRKKTEEALAYERDLLRALLDNIPDRIYFKDVESRFIRCSNSMALRLGLDDPKKIVGKTDFDFHPKEKAQEFYEDEQRIIVTGKALINKLEEQTDLAGKPIWASVTKVPIYNQNGHVTGIIGISRDVTKLKQAEAAMEQARDAALESARVKAQFLANMSHEIRTPMNAITGMSGLLLDTRLNQEQREFVGTIRDSTLTLLEIVNEILDFSKIEAGKLTLEMIDFDLREAVESTVEMLAENAQRKGVELNCCMDQDVPNLLRGDPGRIRQVLANLLSNAIKFTERGEVLIRVTKGIETETTVGVKIEVNDTGVGIPPKAIPLIFQAFTQADGSTTRKHGGTGLGLTISKQLVELMGGEIGVKSEWNKGSMFWLKLAFGKQAAAQAANPPSAITSLAGVRVLVAKKAGTGCQILLGQLSHLRMLVAHAASGGEAMLWLRQEAAAGHPYQLVVLDMDLAEMDGLALVLAIKAEALIASTRLIVLASLGHRLSTATMQESGISACLVKPLRQSRLFDSLVDVMSLSGAGTVLPLSGDLLDVSRVSPLAGAKSARILLAEDNMVNQRLAVKQLKKLGYSADAVADGSEVLNAVEQIHYDIIFMDCQMPEMDGYEVTRRIREKEKDHLRPHEAPAYIIALTANVLHGDREKCLAAGMNDYLTKPLHLSDLEGVLQRALLKVHPAPRPHPERPGAELDPAVLAGLRELREPNQPDPLKELAELFLRDARSRLQRMETAIAQKDAASLAATAHTLKGSASNLGARHLASFCMGLEKQAKTGDLAEAAAILLEIKREFQAVEQTLLAEMQK